MAVCTVYNECIYILFQQLYTTYLCQQTTTGTYHFDIGGKLYDGQNEVMQLNRHRTKAAGDVCQCGENDTTK